jgi:hypothetical protein
MLLVHTAPMRVAVVAGLLAALAAVPSVAMADPPGLTPLSPPGLAPTAPQPEGVPSYGKLTLATDGIAVGILLLAISQESEDLAKLSVGTYLVGAPIVHVTRGRVGRGLLSATMRVALPVVGAMAGASMESDKPCNDPYDDYCGDDEGPDGGIVLGMLGGVLAASIIDAAYLAKGDGPRRPATAWQPTARPTNGGVALGLAGSF